MENSSRQWLLKLLKIGRLTSSSVSKTALPEINRIKDQGFILWERSGSGGVYTLADKAAIQAMLKSTGYHGPTQSLTSKARAVALHGDAHKGKDDTLLIHLSATKKVSWQNNGAAVNIYKIVQDCGMAAILVRPEDNWQTSDPIALVENMDLLVHATRYFKKINFEGSILYYRGWVSKRTCSWLKTQGKAHMIMFPDYDLVGLKNYLFLKKKLPNIKINIPENLSDLLKRYGRAEKLNSSTSRKIIEQTKDTDVQKIYSQLLKYGVGLDQESLMLTD